MRDIRPFGWVIIVINAYIIISFFAGYDVNADDTANGIGIMVMTHSDNKGLVLPPKVAKI